jgi:hypothetical protein
MSGESHTPTVHNAPAGPLNRSRFTVVDCGGRVTPAKSTTAVLAEARLCGLRPGATACSFAAVGGAVRADKACGYSDAHVLP